MISEAVRQHWRQFWQRQNESPIVSIVISRPGIEPQEPPRYLEAFNGGTSYRMVADKIARWYETHVFLEDAVPYYNLSFGADDFAAYLGAELELSADGTTSWARHTLTTLNDIRIAFDPNGKWWQQTAEFYRILRDTLGDEVMISAPTLSAGLDALAGLYGGTELLYALVDEPGMVLDALAQVNAAYTDIIQAVRELFEYDRYGSITRHGMYTDGCVGVPQSDFSYMISQEHFREFALPCIEHEIAALDCAEYHLDGPGNLRHLDMLCTIEKLHTVQWVAGAGEPARQDWTWLYRKIIDLGKAVILGGSAGSVLGMQEMLRTSQAYYTVSVNNADEAHKFMDALWAIPVSKSE